MIIRKYFAAGGSIRFIRYYLLMEIDVWSVLRRIWPFIPHSAGSGEQLWELTVQGFEQLPAALVRLIDDKIEPIAIDDWDYPREDAARLKECLDANGSDKATGNEYYKFYSSVLNDRTEAVFEIGLGTNNTDVASNMGAGGKPGASLRGFRDYLPNARIYGADVDERILFEEERIETRHVDQMDYPSLTALKKWLPPLDLFIDDGLHSLAANLNSLDVGLNMTKPGGWVVIEDITESTTSLWQVIGKLLPEHECYILRAGPHGRMFVCRVAGNSK